jgi:hypothetical protein
VIVPSTAVETMQLGGLAGLTALTMGIGQDGAKPVEPVVPPKLVLSKGDESPSLNGLTPTGGVEI